MRELGMTIRWYSTEVMPRVFWDSTEEWFVLDFFLKTMFQSSRSTLDNQPLPVYIGWV